MRLSTAGDRAFRVAAARAWNSLPNAVTPRASLPALKRHLKTVLFARSYPDSYDHRIIIRLARYSTQPHVLRRQAWARGAKLPNMSLSPHPETYWSRIRR